MRGSCSSSFRSIPSRAGFPRTSPLASLLASSSRSSSSPLSLPSSTSSSFPSTRSFFTSLSTPYRAASWITRNHLKIVETQTQADEQTSPSTSSSSSTSPPPQESKSKWNIFGSKKKPSKPVETLDSIDALEQQVGEETNEDAVAQKKASLRKSVQQRIDDQSLNGRNLEATVFPKDVDWKKMDRLAANRKVPIEYKFKTACFKISPRRLALIGRQLSRRPIGEAILQMEFSVKRASRRLKNSIVQGRNSAIALGMDGDKLFLQAVWVGKGPTISRLDIKGRGRMGIKHHRSARMYFNVVEGKTYMEREHAMHLKVLDIIRRKGVTVHGPIYHNTKARIERVRNTHWRW